MDKYYLKDMMLGCGLVLGAYVGYRGIRLSIGLNRGMNYMKNAEKTTLESPLISINN